MVVLNLLNDASAWAFRLIQQYKTKEELLLANNRLLQVLLELERARSAEEIKALKLENDLNAQRERLGRDLHDCFGSQLTHVISRLDLLTDAEGLNPLNSSKAPDDFGCISKKFMIRFTPDSPTVPPLIFKPFAVNILETLPI